MPCPCCGKCVDYLCDDCRVVVSVVAVTGFDWDGLVPDTTWECDEDGPDIQSLHTLIWYCPSTGAACDATIEVTAELLCEEALEEGEPCGRACQAGDITVEVYPSPCDYCADWDWSEVPFSVAASVTFMNRFLTGPCDP
jgi:hypothetical protein